MACTCADRHIGHIQGIPREAVSRAFGDALILAPCSWRHAEIYILSVWCLRSWTRRQPFSCTHTCIHCIEHYCLLKYFMSSSTSTNQNDHRADDAAAQNFDYGNPPPLGNSLFGAMVGVAPPPPQDPPMRNYRPNSLSQPFNLVDRFKTGKPSLGYGLLLGSPYLARIIGAGGYDWVMIDWEHTPMSIREVTELIRWVQYASEGQTASVVRWVKWR